MYNYFIVMGFVTKDFEYIETKTGKRFGKVVLAVRRDFKNSDGEYDTDFISVTLWEYISDLAFECVKKGMRLGIKGRIVQKTEILASGATVQNVELVGEKLIFLESKPQNN